MLMTQNTFQPPDALVSIEVSEAGVRRVLVYADTVEQVKAAHKLLASIAGFTHSMDVAVRETRE